MQREKWIRNFSNFKYQRHCFELNYSIFDRILTGVDFKTMTQTNLRTGKCRKIRRVDESGAVTTSPASS